MTIVIVQSRLGSTRLPSKALLPLGNKKAIEWTLAAMKMLKVDGFYLATDCSSFSILNPIANKQGFICFPGSENDVLERFCSLVRNINSKNPGKKVKTIIRATGDNPFLFYESVKYLLDERDSLLLRGEKCDYLTYTGFPHGSGVEVLDAVSLLEAEKMTNLPYDREHVGPALYNHREMWNCIFLPSPSQWQYPDFRTTIDTYADYRRALHLVYESSLMLSCEEQNKPFSTNHIISVMQKKSVCKPVLCCPCVREGRGTGHLMRMISVSQKLHADILIPEDSSPHTKDIIQKCIENNILSSHQVVISLDLFQKEKVYALVVCDQFMMEKKIARDLSQVGPLVGIDEGGKFHGYCQILLDIIPSLKEKKKVNIEDISLLSLPQQTVNLDENILDRKDLSVLVCLGGEDPSHLNTCSAVACAQSLLSNKKSFCIDVITHNPDQQIFLFNSKFPHLKSYITFKPPVEDLKKILGTYDLVITHYGLTAFESYAVGLAVILLGTTELHVKLAKKYGFAVLRKHEINAKNFFRLLSNTQSLRTMHPVFTNITNRKNAKSVDLPDFLSSLSEGEELSCPICNEQVSLKPHTVIERCENKTIRRCKKCGMLYPSWVSSGSLQYEKSYFFEEYKKQYGKTYLEDFEHIKREGNRRISIIATLTKRLQDKTILDIGCAYGPFLQAAHDASWLPYGTDISSDAVSYVCNELHFPVCVSVYPRILIEKEFELDFFSSLTMWYVIEHFKDLNSVLIKTNQILRTGGVFAFSTPNASGVSGSFSPKSFFSQSPLDHYSLWELKKCKKILGKYGFKVKKIICTGHHPERFPCIKKKKISDKSMIFKILMLISQFFKLGDTFEVYCIKTSNNI